MAEKVAFRYFTMICWGLYHIHKNGWIHRDIKPDNIFVKKLGENFHILMIGDFGLSKLYHSVTSEDSTAVHDGTLKY